MKVASITCAFFFGWGGIFAAIANPADDAVRVLATSKPMHNPALEIGSVNPDQAKAAKMLFESQMRALAKLKGNSDVAIVPLLVSYLNYSTTISPYLPTLAIRPGSRPVEDVRTLSDRWPAFAAIVSIPGSDDALIKYLSDEKNALDERVAAFLVLRYISKDKFRDVSPKFVADIVISHPACKAYLDAAVDGTNPFEGIFPVTFIR